MMRSVPRASDAAELRFGQARSLMNEFLIALDAPADQREHMLVFAKWRAEQAEADWKEKVL